MSRINIHSGKEYSKMHKYGEHTDKHLLLNLKVPKTVGIFHTTKL